MGESDGTPLDRDYYVRATAEAFGLSPDAAVAHLDQTLARNADARRQGEKEPKRGHVLVIEPDAAYAERFPDAPVEYRWSIECANTDLCGGFEECPESHQIDGEPVNDGPWESDESAPWFEQDYYTFHGVEHEWHYGWNWTVPFEGCVVKANAEECPVWPMRPGRWEVRDEWEGGGEFMTLHVISEQVSPPG